MRKNIAAGNWKMNLDLDASISLAQQIAEQNIPDGTIVILGVPFPFIYSCSLHTSNNSKVFLAAQNCSDQESGAFTGEVSLNQLRSVGAEYIIIGHSERREIFNESDEWLAKKLSSVLKAGMKCIFCCGEPLEIREAGTHVSYVANQFNKSILNLTSDEIQKIIIAYEPIWAIGTGKTASPDQAQEMHAHIRTIIKEKFGTAAADGISVLYGGSVKPKNAKEIFAKEDVDGGLVGGASLKGDTFIPIINSF